MKKLITGATAAGVLALSLLAAGPAQADHLPPNVSCSQVLVSPAQPAVPAVPAIEEVFHYEKGELITPAVEAVPSQWWNFAPNDNKGPFDGPPAFPSDPRGTWNGPHTEGGPAQDQTGTFQNGNGNGSWFHRTPAVEAQPAVYGPDVKVIDVPASPAIDAVPAKPAVTKEECITQVPEHPVTPDVPEAPVAEVPAAPHVPVPTCADLGVTNILEGSTNYFGQNDNDKDGVACEEVSTSPQSNVTPVQPEEQGTLAYTGFSEQALFTGLAALGLGGLALAAVRRRTA